MHAHIHTHNLQSCAMLSISLSFTFCFYGNSWVCPDNTPSKINTLQPRQETVTPPSHSPVVQWRIHTAVATPYNYLICFWQLPFVGERKIWTSYGKDLGMSRFACLWIFSHFPGKEYKAWQGLEVSRALSWLHKCSRFLLSVQGWIKAPVSISEAGGGVMSKSFPSRERAHLWRSSLSMRERAEDRHNFPALGPLKLE